MNGNGGVIFFFFVSAMFFAIVDRESPMNLTHSFIVIKDLPAIFFMCTFSLRLPPSKTFALINAVLNALLELLERGAIRLALIPELKIFSHVLNVVPYRFSMV